MEPTEASVAAPEPGSGPIQELSTTASGRHPARAAVASLSAIVVLAGGIGVVAATRDHGSRPPLVLTPGRRSAANAAPAGAAADLAFSAYRYRLAIAPPDLGADAPVARLEAPAVDDSRIRSMAGALGLHGDATRTPEGGWQVIDGSHRLTVEPTPGGWAVWYAPDAGDSLSGSVPGSAGSGSASTGSTGSTGSGSVGAGTVVGPTLRTLPPGSVAPKTSTVVPPIGAPPQPAPVSPTSVSPAPGRPTPVNPTPVNPVSPTTFPDAPRNLPGSAEAERIARALLGRMGLVDVWWSATVADSNGLGVACAPQPCATPEPVVTARTVVLHPVFNRAVIDGISWQVEIGDNANILGVSGTWTALRTIDRYPLRSVAAVFADLVAGKGTSPGPQPLSAIDAAGAFPSYRIKPVEVAIDGVTLGYSVMPASDRGVAVVDVVPTYVFSGKATGGGDVTQELVAVEATVTTPDTRPGTSPTKPNPISPPGPPIGKPEPQTAPANGATASGTPTT
jgi:hypothetical protein